MKLTITLTSLFCAAALYAQLIPGGPTVNNITNANVSALANDVPYTSQAELGATNAIRIAAEAGKVGTNSVLDKVRIGDGTTLTNMATTAAFLATNSVRIAAEAGLQSTNPALSKLVINDGSSLTGLVTVGVTTNLLLSDIDGSVTNIYVTLFITNGIVKGIK